MGATRHNGEVTPPSTRGGRRAELLEAAVEVVAESGLRGLTHRAVDARAGLPEGSCSAYLRTRHAMITALGSYVASRLTADVRGLSEELALQVAKELTAKDALAAHAEVELGIDPEDITNPWNAAFASMLAFTVGALLPLLTILVFPHGFRAVVTIAAVTAALGLTGFLSARVGEAPVRPAVLRNIVGGLLAMGVTYGIGSLIGVGVG